jgi:hypothetical protein
MASIAIIFIIVDLSFGKRRCKDLAMVRDYLGQVKAS